MLKWILAFAFVNLNFANASEGGGATGADDGGQGVICLQFSRIGRMVNTIESLDLFEMRAISGKMRGPSPNIMYNPTDRSEEVFKLLQRRKCLVSEILGTDHQLLQYFEAASGMKPVIVEDPPLPTNDSGDLQIKLPGSCEVVQIASRSRASKVVKIHTDFAYMEDIDIAAVLMHEALHGFFTEKRSNLVVRQAVGYIFADRKFQLRNQDVFLELISTKRPVDPKRFR
jgi:hypothetical protein